MPALASSTSRTRKPAAPQIARGVETANVRGDAAHDHRGDAAGTQQLHKARMLRRQRVRFEIALESLAPDHLQAFASQTRQEFGSRRSHDAVRRIEIVAPAEKAAMIGWMPVLAGVDARPRPFEQTIEVRHDLQAARHRQFVRAEGRETLLDIDDQQTARTGIDGIHRHKATEFSTKVDTRLTIIRTVQTRPESAH